MTTKTPKQPAKLTKEQDERFDELFCTAVGGSLQMKGCYDVGFGTSPEVMIQVKSFLADELQRQQMEITKLKSDLAHAIGFCRGVGHPERYLEKQYPELTTNEEKGK